MDKEFKASEIVRRMQSTLIRLRQINQDFIDAH